MSDDRKMYAEVAVEIARSAGDLLRAAVGTAFAVEFKGDVNNVVTELDKKVEAYLVGELTRRFPDHEVRAEEGSGATPSGSRYRWHVDPLDGTANFLHGIPWFAVSIGLERLDQPPSRRMVAAAVYNVMYNEMYWAAPGEGAWCNERRISVSAEGVLAKSMLATGFPYWSKTHPETVVESIARVTPVCRDLRRMGSAALDLASVACGRFEGYFEEGLQSWDTAAGALLVREAGGLVTDYDGGDVAIPTTHLIASNGRLHGEMVKLLSGQHREAVGRE